MRLRSVALICALTATALTTAACTENARTRSFGSEQTIRLPCGQKLTEITWKADNLWYATRSFEADETPKTTTFKEDSNYGMMEGTIKVVESQCESGPAFDNDDPEE